MSGVFQNIDPPRPHRPATCTPSPLERGEDALAGWRGGGESIFWKTPDTALYSTYVSTLCLLLQYCIYYIWCPPQLHFWSHSVCTNDFPFVLLSKKFSFSLGDSALFSQRVKFQWWPSGSLIVYVGLGLSQAENDR
jgi:hypothetical protein